MKNYEQKYKAALAWMQSLYKGLHGTTKEDVEHYFPELKESEDEKIRKGLLALLKELVELGGVADDTWSLKECQKYITWIEKQGEQKPAEWSEEDERNLKGIIDEIGANKNGAPDYDLATYDGFLSWLESLKGRVQPKQEWGEYDKIQLSEAIQMIEANGTWIRSEDAVKKVSNWLKSLKTNHWKPSEEQMEIIDMILTNESMDDNVARIMRELKEQLEKL